MGVYDVKFTEIDFLEKRDSLGLAGKQNLVSFVKIIYRTVVPVFGHSLDEFQHHEDGTCIGGFGNEVSYFHKKRMKCLMRNIPMRKLPVAV